MATEQTSNEQTPTVGAILREFGRQIRQAWRDGRNRAKTREAARSAHATPGGAGDPAPGLSAEEHARLRQLLQSWPGQGRENLPA